ncbi:unnamed protein product [Aphanomyces euteiches]
MALADLRLANRNIFIVIVSDAYTDTKKELKLMEELDQDTLAKQIVHSFFHDFMYKVPILGPRLFQPLVERTSKAIAQANENIGVISRQLRNSTSSMPRFSTGNEIDVIDLKPFCLMLMCFSFL